MLPRKRSIPAEPAANPFALAPRRAQISVSDEITKVKVAPPLPPPAPPSRKGAAPTFVPPARKPGVPPPIPRELPRVSIAPPSFDEFERIGGSSERSALAAMLAEELPAPDSKAAPAAASKKKPTSSESIEPMAITHHGTTSSRPNASWAMAMLALGVFGGVVTAILAGGDTTTLLRAGAAFIDPGAPAQNAVKPPSISLIAPLPAPPVAPQRVEPQRTAEVTTPIVGDAIDLGPAPKKVEAKIQPFEVRRPVVAAVEPKVVKAEPKPEPKIAVAPAPVRREAPKPIAKVEKPEKAEKAEKVEKADKADDDAVAAKPSKKKDPMSSAAAADALAKMQLEGAL